MTKRVPAEFNALDYLHPRHWLMWCAFGILRLFSLLPYRAGMFAGRQIGGFIYLFAGSRRQVADINLRHCFPDSSPAERKQIIFQCFQNIGVSLIEMAMCWWWPDEKLKPLVEIKGREHLDAVLASGRGAILLAGHFSSLEISGRLFALSMPLQVMYKAQSNDLFDKYIYAQRSSYFVNTISRKNTRRLIKGIKDKIPTWYAPDQDFRREKNVFAPFLGVATATITASSRIAQASGAAMLPFYPERKADGSGYILRIEAPLEDFPSGDDLKDATAINRSIEKYARLHPDNYLWIHKRFKTRPPGEKAFYP